jgi:hypothetical protein
MSDKWLRSGLASIHKPIFFISDLTSTCLCKLLDLFAHTRQDRLELGLGLWLEVDIPRSGVLWSYLEVVTQDRLLFHRVHRGRSLMVLRHVLHHSVWCKCFCSALSPFLGSSGRAFFLNGGPLAFEGSPVGVEERAFLNSGPLAT